MIKRMLRLSFFAFLGYFGCDMVTPEIAGAFTFDLDSSVEVLASARALTIAAVPVPCHTGARAPDPGVAKLPALERRPSPHVLPWKLPRSARASLARDPASPGEAG